MAGAIDDSPEPDDQQGHERALPWQRAHVREASATALLAIDLPPMREQVG